MDVKISAQDNTSDVSEIDKITIISQHQNVVANCFKVFPSQKMLDGKNAPSYELKYNVKVEQHGLSIKIVGE